MVNVLYVIYIIAIVIVGVAYMLLRLARDYNHGHVDLLNFLIPFNFYCLGYTIWWVWAGMPTPPTWQVNYTIFYLLIKFFFLGSDLSPETE